MSMWLICRIGATYLPKGCYGVHLGRAQRLATKNGRNGSELLAENSAILEENSRYRIDPRKFYVQDSFGAAGEAGRREL